MCIRDRSIGFNFDLSKFGYTAPPKQPELSYPSSVQHGSISNIPPQPVPPPPQPVPPVQAVQGNDLLQSGKNLTTSFKASAFSEIDKMLQRVRERNKGKLHSKSPEQECVRNRRRSSSSESFEDNRGAVKKTLRSTDSQEQKQRHKLKESATDGSERRSGHVLSHEESPSQRHDSRTKSPSPWQHGTRKVSASSQRCDTRKKSPLRWQSATRKLSQSSQRHDTGKKSASPRRSQTGNASRSQPDTRKTSPSPRQHDARQASPSPWRRDTRHASPSPRRHDTRQASPSPRRHDARQASPSPWRRDTRHASPSPRRHDTRQASPSPRRHDSSSGKVLKRKSYSPGPLSLSPPRYIMSSVDERLCLYPQFTQPIVCSTHAPSYVEKETTDAEWERNIQEFLHKVQGPSHPSAVPPAHGYKRTREQRTLSDDSLSTISSESLDDGVSDHFVKSPQTYRSKARAVNKSMQEEREEMKRDDGSRAGNDSKDRLKRSESAKIARLHAIADDRTSDIKSSSEKKVCGLELCTLFKFWQTSLYFAATDILCVKHSCCFHLVRTCFVSVSYDM